jgi:hypothetical protein
MIYNCDYQIFLNYRYERKKGAGVQNRGRETGGIFIWFWILVIFGGVFV